MSHFDEKGYAAKQKRLDDSALISKLEYFYSELNRPESKRRERAIAKHFEKKARVLYRLLIEREALTEFELRERFLLFTKKFIGLGALSPEERTTSGSAHDGSIYGSIFEYEGNSIPTGDKNRTLIYKESFETQFELMSWQRQAIQEWNVVRRRGIVKVATGAGKTYMAFGIIRELPRARVAIIVPTIHLMRQWATKIEQELGIGSREIGFFYGEEHQELRPITIFVVNTAAKFLEKVHRRNPFSLIIYDECHHYGAPSFCTVLEPNIGWKLSLSATPERLNDPDGTNLLIEKIGPIVFTYGLKEAIEDGILAHFDLIKVFTYFNGREEQKYI